MAQVLYRKYRPRNFDDIFGQVAIKQTLKSAIENDSIAHAYLFSGPRGTGKTSMARIFAKNINGIVGEGDTNHLDIIEIDAASNRGIEEIRELRQKINFAPSSLKYKVYIVDEVHMLTKEAFNALLKTLEEPPSHVIFILATTEVNKVPITVLSRTQRYDFKLAKQDEIVGKLEKILNSENVKIDTDGIELIAKLGRGSFRDTETILEKILHSTNEKKLTIENIQTILGITSLNLIDDFIELIEKRQFKDGFVVIKEVENSGVNINYFYTQVLEEFRKKLILSQTTNINSFLSPKELVKIISIFIEASGKLKYSPIEILTLEIALSQIAQLLGDTKDIEIKTVQNEVKKDVQMVHKKEGVTNKVETKKIEKEPVDKTIQEKITTDLTIDDIIRNWEKFLEALKPYNHHLVAFMRKAKPVDVKDGRVILKVGYKFHKQRIEQPKSLGAISDSFKEATGYSFGVECIIDESMKADEKDEPKLDSNEEIVEEIFGE